MAKDYCNQPLCEENELLAALELQTSWGASSVFSDKTGVFLEESNQLIESLLSDSSSQTAHQQPIQETPSVTPQELKKRLSSADSVEEIIAAISLMREVRLIVRSATNVLNPVLVKGSKTLIIGDLPSDEEDRTGQLFTDDLGVYFKAMLRSINMDLSAVSHMTLSPWRLPGGQKRNLAPKELSAIRTLIGKLIQLGGIETIITVGNDAALTVAQISKEENKTSSLMRGIQGQWQNLSEDITVFDSDKIRVFPLPQIKQIIQSAPLKRLVWKSLQTLRDELEGAL